MSQIDGTVSVIGPTSNGVVTAVQASLGKLIADLERAIEAAASRLEVEHAAQVRCRITTLRAQQTHKTWGPGGNPLVTAAPAIVIGCGLITPRTRRALRPRRSRR